jgi:hypothetical protein
VPIFLEEYNKIYAKFKHLPLIIEGPEFDSDYSYFLVDKCDDLKDLEKGIPLINLVNDELFSKEERDFEMEHRILMRINCHKLHY